MVTQQPKIEEQDQSIQNNNPKNKPPQKVPKK
jgi:hypothetical protein